MIDFAADASLFVTLAEIAGVFVGFGALISVTRRGEIETTQHGRLRGLVTIGLLAVIAALLPVVIGRYGVIDYGLWLISSLIFLSLNWAVILFALRRPDDRDVALRQSRTHPVQTAVFWILLEGAVQLPLILIVVGLFPDIEPALYMTAVVLQIFEAAFVLAQIDYAQSERAGLISRAGAPEQADPDP